MPMFDKLDRRELKLLEKLVHVRNYQGDEAIFSEGDVGSGMYFIRSGKVQIFSRDEFGSEHEQALLGSGDFFGETALTASRPRCASARATEPAILIGLFRSDLGGAVEHHPAAAAKILLGINRVISDRLLQCHLQLQDLSKQRLAATERSHE